MQKRQPDYHTSELFYAEDFLPPREARKLKKKGKNGSNVVHPPKKLEPQTESQFYLMEALKQYEQVVTIGPAGTGKTYVSTSYAVDLLLSKKINKIIITRPNVSVGKSNGLLPGDIDDKMDPWVAPVMDIIKERCGEAMATYVRKKKIIEVVPLEFIRGRSFDNAFVLLDEAQNTTIEEMKCFLTRMGKNSQLSINGDIKQKDIRCQSGLSMIIELLKKDDSLSEYINVVEFDSDDIVRSGSCKAWVKAFERHSI